jgi:hypothetical protein
MILATAVAGGQAAGGGSKEEGASVALSAVPDPGYKFVGWRVDGSLVADNPYTFAADADLEAVAEFERASFKVALAMHDGSVGELWGSAEEPVILPSLSRNGFTFLGWRTSASGGSFAGAGGQSYAPSADITLYASWAAAADTPSYHIPPYYSPPAYRVPAAPPAPSPSAPPAAGPSTTPAAPAPIAFAAPAEAIPAYAEELHKLGLLAGTGTDAAGKPAFELERGLTRLEALALVIRLFGKEADAFAFQGENPFGDVPEWGDRYAAYAYEAGITSGVGEGVFAPDRPATRQEMAAFLLRVLRYFEKSGDFAYADSIAAAISKGVFAESDSENGALLRKDAVVSMVNTLMALVNKTELKLISQLAQDGVFSREAAEGFAAAVARQGI